jgi:hypothetical protein
MGRFGRSSVFVACCALPLVSALWVHEVEAMTGNEYLTISALGKVSYINGVMEAWLLANRFMGRDGEPDVRWESTFGSIVRCADKKMTVGQVSALTEKYIGAHPAEGYYDVAALVWSAMLEVCPVSFPDTVDPRGPKGK